MFRFVAGGGGDATTAHTQLSFSALFSTATTMVDVCVEADTLATAERQAILTDAFAAPTISSRWTDISACPAMFAVFGGVNTASVALFLL